MADSERQEYLRWFREKERKKMEGYVKYSCDTEGNNLSLDVCRTRRVSLQQVRLRSDIEKKIFLQLRRGC